MSFSRKELIFLDFFLASNKVENVLEGLMKIDQHYLKKATFFLLTAKRT